MCFALRIEQQNILEIKLKQTKHSHKPIKTQRAIICMLERIEMFSA